MIFGYLYKSYFLSLWRDLIISSFISFFVGSHFIKTSWHLWANTQVTKSTWNLSCLKSNGRCSLKYIDPLSSRSIQETTFQILFKIMAQKHIGHGSYVVYNIASFICSRKILWHCCKANISAWAILSSFEYASLWERAIILLFRTIIQPIGRFHSFKAISASSIASFINNSLFCFIYDC